MIGYFSRRIGRIPFLASLLQQPCRRLTAFSSTPSAVVGWGLKPNAKKAWQYAKRKKIVYISLEDGFIRSVELGVNGSLPLGLAIDHSGIYYDATRPSDLEKLIVESPPHHQIYNLAEKCIALIRRNRLSKYNHAPERLFKFNQSQILVIDQTYDDSSVQYGLASEQSFHSMLNAATKENPQSTILVKIHPDVIAGKKRGYLLKAAQQHQQCQLITDDCNPWSLFDVVDKVYTVTSQMGFEALLANTKVICFGMPFYAGWGITDDRLHSPRRGIERSVHQIFHAAYINYCRYAHPLTHTRCELETILRHLILQKQKRLQFPTDILAVGFSRWKRSFISDFLQGSKLTFCGTPRKGATNLKTQAIAVWGTKFTSINNHYEHVLRIEDGFLRSVGLGAELVRPKSLVIDDIGLYYDATRTSRLEKILNEQVLTIDQIERAEKLRKKITALSLTKYNSDHQTWQRPQSAQTVILVVGQVESDASIRFGSPKIRSNLGLLKQVRADCPSAYIVYKPHPDVVAGLRKKGEQENTVNLYCDEVIKNASVDTLLAQIDELHTMTSLMGFEALMRHVPVICHGTPFYAGWGLTEDRFSCPRRTRKLTLNELVFGALITYPRYVDSDKGVFVEPEDAVDELAALAAKEPQMRRWYRNIFRWLALLWTKIRCHDRP